MRRGTILLIALLVSAFHLDCYYYVAKAHIDNTLIPHWRTRLGSSLPLRIACKSSSKVIKLMSDDKIFLPHAHLLFIFRHRKHAPSSHHPRSRPLPNTTSSHHMQPTLISQDLDSSLELTSQQQISGHAFSLQIWIVMVLWASTIHGIPTRLAENKSFQRLECRSDGGRWAISYQQHLEQPLLNRKIGVPISGRKRVTVLPLLRAIEEVAWAGAASSETTMITAQKQQLTALRTSLRHPSRMGVDGDADDERSPPPLRRTSGDSSSPSLRERYMEKDQGGLGINLSETTRYPVRAIERLADMTKKMDRAIKSDGKFQIQLDNIRESVDAIGVAFVQFGMDDEKVQLIADKVIDALYPIITKGHEQNKADTERR
ncbi:hypothetical protein D6C91_08636 [Aureobasidium pullulans]|uniref:Uncharacterized protein n=1 Tax=Aureobasidium pullulans TaxID=5580 RepID=A0A4S9SN31_AURPU|nr:hypothetical protein D6C91_08636 [Aureobasidium pullulans]